MNKWTRRALITTGALAGGGLVLGVGGLLLAPRRLKIGRQSADGRFGLTTWVALGSDDSIRIYVPHCDIGQGSQTALAMMLADEMDADWAQVQVAEAPARPEFANNHILSTFLPVGRFPGPFQRGYEFLTFAAAYRWGLQPTGGSASVRGTGQVGMRLTGAAARAMLVAAAADRWDVAAGEITVEKSRVSHATSGRSASFGELAAAAAERDPPLKPKLKTRKEFRLIGTPQRRLDVPGKVDGSAPYGIDARVPGMLYAAIRIAPVFGGQLQSCDTAAVEKLPGVSKVVKLSNAVAVVADNWYRANKAVAQLEPVFTDNGAGKVDSAAIAAAQAQALDSASAEPAVKKGDVAPVLASAANKVVKARYAVPFLAHATLEPMNATAQFKDGKLDLWTSVQDPLNALYIAKGQLDLDAENVTMHHRHVGGGFGRRLPGQFDFVEQAVAIARECAPTAVKLIWSREQDMTHGYFRPAVTAELSGALDASGQLLAWTMRCAGSSAGSAGNPPYNVANLERIDLPASNHVRTGPWRSVEHSIHGFTIECFTDELAAASGTDPVEFRRELLQQDPRSLAVLDRVAKMAQWGAPLPENRFRGVALVNSFGSYVAEVAEIEVIRGETGQPLGLRVPRVWAAVDCGIVVNPMTAQQQIEGGIVFGLSAALGESITIEAGAVKQANFNQYDLLRMPDAPQVEVEFITADAAPGGLGEPGTPPIAAAVANAWFAATGQRLRELPLRPAIEAAARS